MASHIVLNEVGATFDLDEVDTAAGRTKSGINYHDINPKGYVPALKLNDGEILTEGASVLQYIAEQHPEYELVPATGTLARARFHEYLNYTSSELHKAFGPLFSDTATDRQKSDAIRNVSGKFDYLETFFTDGRKYLLGDKFTVADAYMFVVSNWSNFVGIDLTKWSNFSLYIARVAARPSAQAAMKTEGLI